ncbi:MAG: hypothetical protein KDK36_07230, partial [Leptospiraceae bacterium]|nr:hypothetical protein [Leptospiraceae bacterium]
MRARFYYCIIFILSILLLNCKEEFPEDFFCTEVKGIQIFEDSKKESKILGVIPFKEKFIIFDRKENRGKWKKVKYGNIKGYIFKNGFSKEITNSIMFVDSLEGIDLFSFPNKPESKITNLPHRSKIEIKHTIDLDLIKNSGVDYKIPGELTINNIKEMEGFWLYIKYNDL